GTCTGTCTGTGTGTGNGNSNGNGNGNGVAWPTLEGAAAARGHGASRGSAIHGSNARTQHIHVLLAPCPRATAASRALAAPRLPARSPIRARCGGQGRGLATAWVEGLPISGRLVQLQSGVRPWLAPPSMAPTRDRSTSMCCLHHAP